MWHSSGVREAGMGDPWLGDPWQCFLLLKHMGSWFFPPVCSFAHSQRSVDLQQHSGALSTGGEGLLLVFFPF